MRRFLALMLASVALLSVPASATAAAPPRASLTDIENDVMCVSCREPLALAQSPQAESERAFIRQLIAQGLTKRQIEQALVAQYGPAVLGKPPAHGFDLAVYIVPPALVLLGVITLALVLPRWRRRTRTEATPPTPAPTLGAQDAQRLDADLARFDG